MCVTKQRITGQNTQFVVDVVVDAVDDVVDVVDVHPHTGGIHTTPRFDDLGGRDPGAIPARGAVREIVMTD